jgi:hypothetical protein
VTSWPKSFAPPRPSIYAFTHHSGASHTITADQWLAAAPVFIDDPATARTPLIISRIARTQQHRSIIHQQRHATAQLKRAGQERIMDAITLQLDSLPGSALIDRLLYPLCV